MPLRHAEDLQLQNLAVHKSKELGWGAQYAAGHRSTVEQYGRLPARNKDMGRESTEAEKAAGY